MKTLLPNEINQPKGAMILEEKEIGAHPQEIMGGGEFNIGSHIQSYLESQGIYGVVINPLFPDGDCSKLAENLDIQRLVSGEDPFDCVTCSHQSGIDISERAQYNQLPKQSRRFTAVDSGTIPGRGNSNSAVQTSIKKGMVAESSCPSNVLSLKEFYAPLPSGVYSAEDFKKYYDVYFIPLPTRDGVSVSRFVLSQALPFGPVVVCVNGRYTFDSHGWVTRPDQNDTHDVLMCALSSNGTSFDTILDSETQGGFIPFSPTYDYHYPYLIYVLKKNMFQLVKEASSPAVYLLCLASGDYYAIADSEEISGGDLLKSFSGTYGNAGIQHVATIDHTKIVGQIQARKEVGSLNVTGLTVKPPKLNWVGKILENIAHLFTK